MGLDIDIRTKIDAAVAANEIGDFATVVTKLRSAIMLIAARPRTKFENDETEYSVDQLESLLKNAERQLAIQQASTSGGGGIKSIPVRTDIDIRYGTRG